MIPGTHRWLKVGICYFQIPIYFKRLPISRIDILRCCLIGSGRARTQPTLPAFIFHVSTYFFRPVGMWLSVGALAQAAARARHGLNVGRRVWAPLSPAPVPSLTAPLPPASRRTLPPVAFISARFRSPLRPGDAVPPFQILCGAGSARPSPAASSDCWLPAFPHTPYRTTLPWRRT